MYLDITYRKLNDRDVYVSRDYPRSSIDNSVIASIKYSDNNLIIKTSQKKLTSIWTTKIEINELTLDCLTVWWLSFQNHNRHDNYIIKKFDLIIKGEKVVIDGDIINITMQNCTYHYVKNIKGFYNDNVFIKICYKNRNGNHDDKVLVTNHKDLEFDYDINKNEKTGQHIGDTSTQLILTSGDGND